MAQFDPNSLDYAIPKVVDNLLEKRYRISNAMATTAALFAGALVSLAQLVAEHDNQTPSWEALRFFVYAAIGSNLVTVAGCLWTISGLSDVPERAQLIALRDINSLVYKHGAQQPIPQVPIGNEYQIMTQFGMVNHYRWQIIGAGLWYLIGLFLTFTALVFWIWLSQSIAVAASVTVVLTPGCIGIVAPIFAAGLGNF